MLNNVVHALHTRVEQKIILFRFGNQFNKRWLYVSGLDVLGQSPRHNICAFIEHPIGYIVTSSC